MTDEFDDQGRGWRVVEGPGAEDTDEDAAPPDHGLGSGPGIAAADAEGEPGPLGPAPGEIPESTGPNAVIGLQGLATADDVGEEQE